MGSIVETKRLRRTIGAGAAWMFCLLFCTAGAASETVSFQLTGEAIVLWLVKVVISVLVWSGWFWLGSRMFRQKPTYTNCLIAAIVPQILFAVLLVLAMFIFAFFACFSVTFGAIALILILLYLIILYVKWVRDILEIKSTGLACFLVFLATIADAAVSWMLRQS